MQWLRPHTLSLADGSGLLTHALALRLRGPTVGFGAAWKDSLWSALWRGNRARSAEFLQLAFSFLNPTADSLQVQAAPAFRGPPGECARSSIFIYRKGRIAAGGCVPLKCAAMRAVAVLVRVWLILITCWSLLWLVAFWLFFQDDPPSLTVLGFQHMWMMITLPWGLTLLATLLWTRVNLKRPKSSRGIQLVAGQHR